MFCLDKRKLYFYPWHKVVGKRKNQEKTMNLVWGWYLKAGGRFFHDDLFIIDVCGTGVPAHAPHAHWLVWVNRQCVSFRCFYQRVLSEERLGLNYTLIQNNHTSRTTKKKKGGSLPTLLFITKLRQHGWRLCILTVFLPLVTQQGRDQQEASCFYE